MRQAVVSRETNAGQGGSTCKSSEAGMGYAQTPGCRPCRGREDGGGSVTQWFKYVSHDELICHMALGWEVSDDLWPSNHGHYASLCVWKGDGLPDGADDDEPSLDPPPNP
jgi:hypothetical protein